MKITENKFEACWLEQLFNL